MLSLFRRSGRLVAPIAVALAAMVLLGTADWWHTTDAEDSTVASIHDHASHHPVLKATRPSESRPGEHCFLCHWLRSFQNGLRASSAYGMTTVETRFVQPPATRRPRQIVVSLLPARAPPA